jgi:AraC family transcriptional regulator, melibiose operon regulatory protein
MQSIANELYGFATNTHPPGLMSRPHRHNEIELNYLEKGAMSYFSNGRRIEIQRDQIALFWAAIPHQLIDIEEETVLYWITIPFATFLQWRLPNLLTQRVIRGQFVLSATSEQLQSSPVLFKQWQADLAENSPEHRRIVLLEIEAHIRRQAIALSSMQPAEELTTSMQVQELSKVEQMASYIAEHYIEPLHVEDIARAVNFHPNYAMSLFRKHFGLSIVEYLTQYRLASAQHLLIATDATTSAIALEAGFGSVSRFYSAFKRAYGLSPGNYRAFHHANGAGGSLLQSV